MAFVALQRGRPLAAWGDIERRVGVASVRKSLLGALIGRAVARGTLHLTDTLDALGIDDAPDPLTTREKTATLAQLLAARSGITHPAIDQPGALPPRGELAPGEQFLYNNWDFNILGVIYERATGVRIGEAFAREIAAPTGMLDFEPGDVTTKSGPISTHPAYRFRALGARSRALRAAVPAPRGLARAAGGAGILGAAEHAAAFAAAARPRLRLAMVDRIGARLLAARHVARGVVLGVGRRRAASVRAALVRPRVRASGRRHRARHRGRRRRAAAGGGAGGAGAMTNAVAIAGWEVTGVPAALRMPRRRRGRRLGPMLAGSASLHLLLLALVIVLAQRAPPPLDTPPATGFTLVFAPAHSGASRAPVPSRRPSNMLPIPPPVAPVRKPAPPRIAPPPPPPIPRPLPAAPPAPLPAPRPPPVPAPAPAPAPPPAVSLGVPFALPQPVPIPRAPPPLPVAQARPALPSRGVTVKKNPFAAPMALSFGGPARRGPLDLSAGRFSHALSAMQPATSAQSDDVGAGWLNALSAWLHQHGYYPQAAVANGDEGIVRVRFVVLQDGTVKSVELLTPSRSPFLNMAPPAWLRGARLPALPPGTKDGQATVVLTVRFILIR